MGKNIYPDENKENEAINPSPEELSPEEEVQCPLCGHVHNEDGTCGECECMGTT